MQEGKCRSIENDKNSSKRDDNISSRVDCLRRYLTIGNKLKRECGEDSSPKENARYDSPAELATYQRA